MEELNLRYGPQWVGHVAFFQNVDPEYEFHEYKGYEKPELTKEVVEALRSLDTAYETGNWDDCGCDLDRLVYDLPCGDGTARVHFLMDKDSFFQMYLGWKWGVYEVNGENPGIVLWAVMAGDSSRFLPPIPQYAFITDLLRLN